MSENELPPFQHSLITASRLLGASRSSQVSQVACRETVHALNQTGKKNCWNWRISWNLINKTNMTKDSKKKGDGGNEVANKKVHFFDQSRTHQSDTIGRRLQTLLSCVGGVKSCYLSISIFWTAVSLFRCDHNMICQHWYTDVCLRLKLLFSFQMFISV